MVIPKNLMLFAGFWILFLSPVLMEDCSEWEYRHNGLCCPACEWGRRVSEHCTREHSTACERCPDGEYSDRYTGSEKCFQCKSCDQELGLQTKENCTYTHDTICEAKEGYYCIDGCQMTRKHTACPPGEGVKEKGTPFKDTVCEECPDGTFSSKASTTEECKNWTVCETLKLKQVEPGSAEADVKCEAEHNWKVVVYVVVAIALVIILTGGGVTFVLRRKRKCKQGNWGFQDSRNHNGDGKLNMPLRNAENA